MEDTTPLLGMDYSHFGHKLAKKQAKREERNVESAAMKDYSPMEDVGSLAEVGNGIFAVQTRRQN